MTDGPILFVIDDINYNGGAHMATARLIAHLAATGRRITVFSSTAVQSEEIGLRFTGADIRSAGSPIKRFDQMGIMEVLHSKSFSPLRKAQRVAIGVLKRLGLYYPVVYDVEKRMLGMLLSECEEAVVVGENSIFADFVARNSPVRKVIMLHTDYDALARFERYTPFRRSHDLGIYLKMDAIGVVGEGNCERFKRRHPKLASKCLPFYNYIPDLSACRWPCAKSGALQPFRMLTVCRFDANKDVLRLLRIAAALKKSGLGFEWDIFGDGPQFLRALEALEKRRLGDCVRLPGYVRNDKIVFSDYSIMVMASHYEGDVPLVVLEALSSRLPVLATDVGSMGGEIAEGETGWIVEDSDSAICGKLRSLVREPQSVACIANNLEHWSCGFDNAKVDDLYRKLLGL